MKRFLFISLFFCFILSAAGQQNNDSAAFTPQYKHGLNYIFKTTAGTTFKGFVINETRDFVTIENRDVHETYELRKQEIMLARTSSDRASYNDIVLGENYHARNYMFAQSAMLFNEGKLSSTTHLLLLDNLDYALSENWAISANSVAFFYPVSFGVKFAYEVSDGNYIGGNVFGIGLNYSTYNSSSLFGYGLMGKFTKGTSNENFTAFGGVIGLNTDLFFRTASTFVNTAFCGAAYCRRFNKLVALNLEGWYLPAANVGLVGAGIKLVGDETNSWTFGCYSAVSQHNKQVQVNLRTLPIPYFGYSRNF